MQVSYSICSAHQLPDKDPNCKACNVTINVKYLRKIKINDIFDLNKKITLQFNG